MSKTNGLPKTSDCRKKIEYSHIFRDSDVIDPSKLSIDEKERFIDSLYQLNSQIFDGVDRGFWRNHTHPTVKFYVKANPGYVSGSGLLTLVPLRFENIFRSLIRFMKNKLVRHFSR